MSKSLIRFAKKINFKLEAKHLEKLSFYFKIGKLYCVVQCPNWFKVGNYRGGTLNNIESKNEIRSTPCVKPFREFTIYYNGNVTPCCDIYNGTGYNLNKIEKVNKDDHYSIFKIYASKKLSDWRKGLFNWSPKKGVCAMCEVEDLATKKDIEARNKIESKLIN